MADTIKVKPKKNYEWNQDNKFIYVRIPMPSHTSLKKLEIFLSDLILRVTSLEKKSTHFIDLINEIDYKSAENKFTLTEGEIHATLKKKDVNIQWEKLILQDISLAELKTRRRQSEARYEQNVKQVESNKQKLKLDYDRKATQQLMRFEQQERDKLENKKKIEKQQAIKEIFSNVNEKTGNIQYQNTPVSYQQQKWKQKEQLALKLIQEEEEKQQAELKKQKTIINEQRIVKQIQKQIGIISQQKLSTAASKSIFTGDDVQDFNKMREDVGEVEYQQIPVRKVNNVTVKFTERVFPHLAARDTHVKEPPMPKSKSNQVAPNGDVDSKNPLWLKDKGNQFLKDKNYISAIEAYTQAISLDNKMMSSYANRSLCHLKMFNFNGVISDCQQCLNLMKGQLGGAEEDNQKSFKFMIKITSRKALAKAWKGQLKDAKTELSQILYNNELLDPETKQEVQRCIHLISQREQSIGYKLKGDEQVKLGNYERAVAFYDQSIGVDKNEYSISNKALCLNKLKKFNKSIETINEGIEKVNFFNLNTKPANKQSASVNENKKPITILLKLFYRKAKALQELDKIKQAEQTLHKGLIIDSSDKDFQSLLKEINYKKNKLIIKEDKQRAVNLIKQSKHDQALKIYQKCLKIIESQDDIQEYLSILQNQCVCYLKSNDYDSIISTSIRILKIISNVQSKIVEFGGKKAISLSNEQMNKISVRTLMRRANAYLKKNQIHNAKLDLEKALQINPRDQVVQKELEKIKQQLCL